MLNERGKLIGDFTLCRLAEDRFFLIGTYAAERYYLRWFERHTPPGGRLRAALRMEYVGLSVAGPHSRELLQSLVATICRPPPFRSCRSASSTSA